MSEKVQPPASTTMVLPDWELVPLDSPASDQTPKLESNAALAKMGEPSCSSQPTTNADETNTDTPFVATPFDAQEEARSQHMKDRLQLLKVRASVVGALGIVGVGVGVWTLGDYGPALVDACLTLWSSSQAVHIPSSLFTERNYDKDQTSMVLQWTLMAIGFLGLAIMRRDGLEGIRRSLLIGSMVLISAYSLYINLADWGDRRALESAVTQKDWAKVNQLLNEFPVNVPRRYVQAQVAKAAGDVPQLRTVTAEMLSDLDHLVEMAQATNVEGQVPASVHLRLVRGLDAKVIHDLDVEVNRHPRSEVSIAFAKGNILSNHQEGSLAPRLLMVVLMALLMLSGAIAAMGLWFRMETRIRRLTAWVENPFQPYR